jgi:hypothetical protein
MGVYFLLHPLSLRGNQFSLPSGVDQ